MKGLVAGIVVTLVAIACGAFLISNFGLYPIGADNPPGTLERVLAGRAMDVYAEKHKPAGDNPVQLTAAAPTPTPNSTTKNPALSLPLWVRGQHPLPPCLQPPRRPGFLPATHLPPPFLSLLFPKNPAPPPFFSDRAARVSRRPGVAPPTLTTPPPTNPPSRGGGGGGRPPPLPWPKERTPPGAPPPPQRRRAPGAPGAPRRKTPTLLS